MTFYAKTCQREHFFTTFLSCKMPCDQFLNSFILKFYEFVGNSKSRIKFRGNKKIQLPYSYDNKDGRGKLKIMCEFRVYRIIDNFSSPQFEQFFFIHKFS